MDIEYLWNDTTYNVIHLDFIFYKLSGSTDEFLTNFNYNLKNKLCSLEPDIFNSDNCDTPANILENILKKHDNLVLLIDEFDVPLTYTSETAPKIGLVAHFNLSLVARFIYGPT